MKCLGSGVETYMMDFWTHNGGLTVYAKLAGEFE